MKKILGVLAVVALAQVAPAQFVPTTATLAADYNAVRVAAADLWTARKHPQFANLETNALVMQAYVTKRRTLINARTKLADGVTTVNKLIELTGHDIENARAAAGIKE